MADLEIVGTHDEQWGIMKSAVIQLHGAINGNGKPGLEANVSELGTRLTTIEAYGKASAFWGKVIAGLLTLLIAGIGLYFTSLEIRGKSKLLTPPAIFQSSQTEPVLSATHHTADLPPTYEMR